MSYPGGPEINVGEWNAPLYINAGVRLVGHSVWLVGIRPSGSLFGGLCYLGTGDVNLPLQTMLEGQWVIYVIQEGDLTEAGVYTCSLEISPPVEALQVPQAIFTVGA